MEDFSFPPYSNTPSDGKWHTVTPALARTFFEDRIQNRLIYQPAVERAKRSLRNNTWYKTHQGWNFVWNDNRWRLDDGQHRCRAIIETGISANVMITFGGDPRGVDQGRSRTFSQELVKRGGMTTSTANNLAAAAKNILTWNVTGYAPGYGPNFTPSYEELDSFLAEHPCVESTLPNAERLRASTRIRCSVGAWFIFVISHNGTDTPRCLDSPVDGGAYLEGLTTGANLEQGHPALTLRDRLYKDPSFKKDALSLAVALVYSWNNYRNGTKSKIVKVQRTGDNKITGANFPIPVDGWFPPSARARREGQERRK